MRRKDPYCNVLTCARLQQKFGWNQGGAGFKILLTIVGLLASSEILIDNDGRTP
jgi:hypothetical protein